MKNVIIQQSEVATNSTTYQQTYPALNQISRSTITTEEAAYYLNRKPQTLRAWACLEKGPLRPIRINRRLAWPVSAIQKLLHSA
jgi:hypothetical protein